MSSSGPPVLGEPLPLELANTRFLRRGAEQDGLREPRDLADWLRQLGDRLPFALDDAALDAIGPAELEAARAVRDALRVLLADATTGTALDADAAATLNAAVREAPRWAELAPGARPEAVPRSSGAPVPAVLGAIGQEAIGLLTGAGAATLRACAAPGCMLFYVKDHPRRAWCSPRCSNRVRAARHYARRTARD